MRTARIGVAVIHRGGRPRFNVVKIEDDDSYVESRLLEIADLYRRKDGKSVELLLQRLRQDGWADATLYLANLYEEGCGELRRNVPLAVDLYEEDAARKPNALAFGALARIHFQGDLGEPDLERAFYYYDLLARSGDARAQFVIGDMYARGLHVAQDIKVARLWFEDAARGGNVFAMINIALMDMKEKQTLRGLCMLTRRVAQLCWLRLFDRNSDRLLRI